MESIFVTDSRFQMVIRINYEKESLELHKKNKGKIEIISKVPLETKEDLSLAYTPGVAGPSKEIVKNKDKVYDYTNKGNSVAIITDGSAVLGLGNIGPEAALPVMEGKAILFKKFANIDAFPVCLNTQDIDELVNTVKLLEPCFGGINLEDISSPRCFEIERRLIKEMNIPVFHDDQHGTAIVLLAALINASKFVDKELKDLVVVISGAGAAGLSIARLLRCMGYDKKVCTEVKEIFVCDSMGIIYKGRDNLNKYKKEIAEETNHEKKKGSLKDALKGADVFIGVSAPHILTKEMIKTMNKDPIIFAMANPVPEIGPEDAKKAGARIVSTGRSDYPNQVNNALAFPGLFKGALDVRASRINNFMKISAAYALASLIFSRELREDYIIPDLYDKRVVEAVSRAVAKAAIETKVART